MAKSRVRVVTANDGPDKKVYLLKDARKFWVVNEETLVNLGFNWAAIQPVDPQYLEKIPTGEPMTSATQKVYDSDDYVYCIEKTWSDNFSIGVCGWAIGKKKTLSKLKIEVDGQVKTITSWASRPEIADYFKANTTYKARKKCGFSIVLHRAATHEFRFMPTGDAADLATEYTQENRIKPAGFPTEKNLKQRFIDIVNTNKLSVIEVGSRISPGGDNQRRHFKDASHYVGFDYHDGETVDVVGDAHLLSKYFTETFDSLYSDSVLEHLAAPWKAVIEMNKVLNVGGYVFHSAPSTWALHDMPWDFWRFSDAGLKSLFSEPFGFKVIDVEYTAPVLLHLNSKATDDYAQMPFAPAFGFVAILAQKTHNIKSRDIRFNHSIEAMVEKDTVYPLWVD